MGRPQDLRDRDTYVAGGPLKAIRNGANVSFGSIASFWSPVNLFRFTPINGHRQTGSAGPLRAKFRHRAASLDDLVGEQLERIGHGEAEGCGGLEIDD